MKLYARIENEKGKVDGMGGNEYLDIDITVGNNRLMSLTVRASNVGGNDGYGLFDDQDEQIAWIVTEKKKCNCGVTNGSVDIHFSSCPLFR